jgi:dienelactone hydrolase
MTARAIVCALALLSFFVDGADAQDVPRDIAYRRATVLSDRIPLAAHVFQHRAYSGTRRPTVILCHGWGGEAAGLRRQAIAFANAGLTAITFDYRGWGESGGRVVLKDPATPSRRDGKPYTAEVIEQRDLIHPWERIQDVVAMLSWAVAEPDVDAKKIGLWGTSYGAGHVLHVAAHDERVRAIVTQVGSFDSRRGGSVAETWREYGTKRARGELPPPVPTPRTPGRLYGFPVVEHLLHYAPVEQAGLLRADQAVLIIAAEKEELMDNREHGEKVHARVAGPKQYVVIPGISHFEIYTKAFDQATKLATDWYEKYLK